MKKTAFGPFFFALRKMSAFVARELAPARLRSDRNTLGPLRSPAGATTRPTGVGQTEKNLQTL
ncbi:hypothetical protein ACIPQ1_08800 [Pseudomonas sp. LARHCG127]